MEPTQSYRIWFTPRTGSTLLCKGLEDTGIAGKPGEFFTLFEHNSLLEKYEVSDYKALKQRLWREGTSANGVFGTKMFNDHKVMNELKQLRDNEGLDSAFLSDLFPNCKDIFLTRRNKVRQAVSWWKAIKDNVWHIQPKQRKEENGGAFYEANYDFAALSHLFKEAMLRECAIQEFFMQHDIHPLTIVYEDMVSDFQGTIKRFIRYLNIAHDDFPIPQKYFQKTADSASEQWVQRFRKDLQQEMGQEIW